MLFVHVFFYRDGPPGTSRSRRCLSITLKIKVHCNDFEKTEWWLFNGFNGKPGLDLRVSEQYEYIKALNGPDLCFSLGIFPHFTHCIYCQILTAIQNTVTKGFMGQTFQKELKNELYFSKGLK